MGAHEDDLIRAAALSFLHGEDWGTDTLAELADALGVDRGEVEALDLANDPNNGWIHQDPATDAGHQ